MLPEKSGGHGFGSRPGHVILKLLKVKSKILFKTWRNQKKGIVLDRICLWFLMLKSSVKHLNLFGMISLKFQYFSLIRYELPIDENNKYTYKYTYNRYGA